MATQAMDFEDLDEDLDATQPALEGDYHGSILLVASAPGSAQDSTFRLFEGQLVTVGKLWRYLCMSSCSHYDDPYRTW